MFFSRDSAGQSLLNQIERLKHSITLAPEMEIKTVLTPLKKNVFCLIKQTRNIKIFMAELIEPN